jgi:hypothetical protein
LSHSPECKCVGTKKVKGSFIEKPCPNPEIRGHKWGTMQGNRGARGHGDRDGTETTQDWKCVDGCPVKEFPTSSVTGKRSDRSRAAVVKGTQWLSDNHESIEYTDSGSVARFFHAVAEFEIEEGEIADGKV